MKFIKKAVSVCLVLGLLFAAGGMAGAVSAGDFTDFGKIRNTGAVTMLTDLGVISGITAKDGTASFAPEDYVTRAQMAKMIAYVLGCRDASGYTGAVTFSDAASHWAKPYIGYCASLGIIDGYSNGKFGPDDVVTGSQAAKMLLISLGYKSSLEGFTGAAWETNVNSTAEEAGIYKDFENEKGKSLTRDGAALLIYNTLFLPMIEKYMGSTAMEYTDGRILAVSKLGLTVVSGVVTANEYASLTNDNTSLERGKTTFASIGTQNVSTSLDMLGKTVEMYVRKNSAGSVTGIYGEPGVSDKNKVYAVQTGISLKTFADNNDLTIDDTTAYYKNFVSKDSNGYAITITAGVNGATTILIDNDNDGVIEYVTQTVYSLGTIKSIDESRIEITGANSAYYLLNASNGYTGAKKGDHVLFTELGGKLIYMAAGTVSGCVTSVTTTYSGTFTKMNMDGISHIVSGLENKTELYGTDVPPSVGDDVTAYLDPSGSVIAYRKNAETDTYALVLDYEYEAGDKGNDYTAEASAFLLLPDGKKSTFEVASVNGEKVAASKFDRNSDNALEAADTKNPVVCKYAVVNGKADLVVCTDLAGSASSGLLNGVSHINAGGRDFYAGAGTVFYFVNTKSGKIRAYSGIANVPSCSDSEITVAYGGSSGNAAKAVVVKSDVDYAYNAYLYLLSTDVTKTAEGYYEYAAAVDGKEIVLKAVNSSLPSAGLYTYKTDQNGIATVAVDYSQSMQVVSTVKASSLTTNYFTYDITDDTEVYAVSERSATKQDVDYLESQQRIYVVPAADDAKEAALIYVIE